MEEKKIEEIEGIPPYRMNQIIQAAAAATDQIVRGKHLYNPSYRECEIAVELIAEAIRKSREEHGGK